MEDYILQVKNVTKRFNGLPALEEISFNVKRGEMHALMGENGAGKSTFIKILTGLYTKEEGTIVFDGENCDFRSTLDAQHAGISTIYQELNMIPYLTVSENIFLGRYPQNAIGIDWKKMNRDAQKMIDDLGVDIDVKKKLNEYGTAKQQIVSIIRAVSLKSKLIVMDEPTSSLDTKEVQILFGIIDRLKEQGITIIFVSHRLSEVFAKCDRLTILKNGKFEGTYDIHQLTELELIQKMIGNKDIFVPKNSELYGGFEEKETLLEARNLTRMPFVDHVSFSIKKGEVLGFAGLLGSGRTELVRLLFGCDTMTEGEILIENQKVSIRTPEDAVAHKLAFCTENRREEGIFPDMSVKSNIGICTLKKLQNGLFISRKKETELSENYIDKLKIKASSREQLIKNLSGGNQQKVLLARWMATHPKLIILDDPTRGIDIGAKAEIEKIIRELQAEGISIIYISSEMPELIRNCDRIIVLREGKISGEIDQADGMNELNIMKLMATDKSEEKSK